MRLNVSILGAKAQWFSEQIVLKVSFRLTNSKEFDLSVVLLWKVASVYRRIYTRSHPGSM